MSLRNFALAEALERRRLLTTLTFDAGSVDGGKLSQDYGDHVTNFEDAGFNYGSDDSFTPNVSVSYRGEGGAVRTWANGFGTLQNAVYADDSGEGILRITLTADPGYQVVLHSFDLASFGGLIDRTINSVRVLDGAGATLFNAATPNIQGGLIGEKSSRFNAFDGLTATTLQIRIDAINQGDASDDIGIDNVYFTQTTGGSSSAPLNKPLYVITHGLEPSNGMPSWIYDMASAIAKVDGLPSDEQGPDSIIQASRATYDGTIAPGLASSPNFILFDWSAVSRADSNASSDIVAGELAALVRDRLPETGTIDVHFIGHSRGCYVIAEAIRRLKKTGDDAHIGFLQMTTLDPQNYLSDGTLESNPGGIVDLADNYFQTVDNPLIPDLNLEGEPIPGAINVDLTNALNTWNGRTDLISANHQEVHDWYHWTIDTDDSSDDQPQYLDPVLNTQQAKLVQQATDGTFTDRTTLYKQVVDLDLDGAPDPLEFGRHVGFHYSRAVAFAPGANHSYSGLDLVFVIDATSSMADDIAGVKANAIELVKSITSSTANVNIGIVTYKDFPDSDSDYVSRTLLPMTSDPSALIAAINSIEVAGGGDNDEAVYSGIMHALDMKDGLGEWRGGTVRKAIILYGDAPAKDPEPYTGYTRASVVLRSYNIDPADVFTVAAKGADDSTLASFEQLASSTQAMSFDSEAGDSFSSLVNAVAQATEAVAFAAVDDGALNISGTGEADTIALQLKNHKLVVSRNGESLQFSSSSVRTINLVCGDGNDLVQVAAPVLTPVYVSGGSGNDTIFGGSGNDTLSGGGGRNQLFGNAGDDRLNGSAAADSIAGGLGKDRIFGFAGADTLDGGDQPDHLYGGDDNDLISGGSSNDYLYGENGNDTLSGGNQNDILDGGANVDRLYGNAGNDTMYGGGGNDRLEGGDGNDSFRGGAGNDTFFARDNLADILKGDGGSDSAQFDLLDTTRISIQTTIA